MNKFVGVDIGGTKMYMVAEWNGEYIEKKVPTGITVTKEYIKGQLDNFISELPFVPHGIGMALPGLVDGKDKLVISNVVPNLGGVTTDYFERDNCKVYFINDVKAALVGEAMNYPEDTTVALIMAGTGFALSVKTSGVTVLGSKGWAGELGFVPMCVNNKVIKVDELASGAAILKKAKVDVGTLLNAIDNREAWATDIIEEAGFYFGLALVNVIHMFNPDVIVVGGSTSTYRGYMEIAVETAKEYALEDCFKCCSFTTPKDIKRVVALGARKFAINNY